jgi:hypothetical protein
MLCLHKHVHLQIMPLLAHVEVKLTLFMPEDVYREDRGTAATVLNFSTR